MAIYPAGLALIIIQIHMIFHVGKEINELIILNHILRCNALQTRMIMSINVTIT